MFNFKKRQERIEEYKNNCNDLWEEIERRVRAGEIQYLGYQSIPGKWLKVVYKDMTGKVMQDLVTVREA